MTIYEFRDHLQSLPNEALTLAELESLSVQGQTISMKASTSYLQTVNNCLQAIKEASEEMKRIRDCATDCAALIRQLSAKEVMQ